MKYPRGRGRRIRASRPDCYMASLRPVSLLKPCLIKGKSINVRKKTRTILLCFCFRAEALSEPLTKPFCKLKSTNMKVKTAPVRTHFPLGPNPFLEKPQPFISPQSCDAQGQRYTAEEIEVLR